MPTTKPSRRGRPPAGARPGERVTDYPQLSLRIPHTTLLTLQAASTVIGEPQWRVLADAVNRYIAQMPPHERGLLDGLLRRAGSLFAQPSKRNPGPKVDQLKVLNVDDNEAMLFARSTMMRKEGWLVMEAQTGRAALELLKRHRPDVVLLDVHLPDISGLEICRRIKGDPRTRDIKVVQLSATVKTPIDQLHSLEQGGADIYLTEPLARGTLLSVIERLVKTGTAA